MHKLILTLGMTAALAGAVNGSAYVVTTNNNVGIYEHQSRKLFETPLFTVDKNVQLMVVTTADDKMKIRNADGRTGWVEKNAVKTVSSRALHFSDAEVMGYLENPVTTIIFDGNESPEQAIRLDRSFKESLSVNVDRETVRRMVK